ncbi:hypothetical protein RRG08_007466 [Elysia crispata]|uniref:Uncharacterized protein n=1 Tax=Elysia crispata TaxID=231223 RepID=A0AAE0XMV0_9GAST|nr:hypothetical protein RRG08_007466 [Elysia crispata]
MAASDESSLQDRKKSRSWLREFIPHQSSCKQRRFINNDIHVYITAATRENVDPGSELTQSLSIESGTH